MSNYLFMATIPSIGKLISSSRKTEDIWAGSFLVAYLIKNILKEITSHYQNKIELIFPSDIPSEKNQFADISNKILLLCNGFTRNEINELGDLANKTTYDNLKQLVNDAFNKCNISDSNYEQLAYYQAEKTIELFWSAVEITDDYKKSRQALEEYIGYLKDSTIRRDEYYQGPELISSQTIKGSFDDFQKSEDYLKYCAGAYTCTVCNENTILGASLSDYKGNKFWEGLWTTKKDKFKKGERLCGFCLIKRYLSDYIGLPSFPSTSEIATICFKRQLIDNQNILNKLIDIFGKVIKKLSKGNQVPRLKDEIKNITNKQMQSLLELDGECLMVDTWKNPNNYKNYEITDEEATKIAEELEKTYKEYKAPPEMYAILKVDGDNMGAKISALDKKEQQALSSAQLSFIGEISDIITHHYGAVIYIGGDDVFAFLPFEESIKCAQEIRKMFAEYMKEIEEQLLKRDKKDEYKFTLTGALLLAHHLLPLKYVLNELYALEKDAKKVEGKNSLAIKSIKHSLSSNEVIIKWDKLENLYKISEIPKSFVYQLSSISPIFEDKDNNFHKRQAIIKSLLKGKVSKAKIDEFIDRLLDIDERLDFGYLSAFLRLAYMIGGKSK